MGAAADIENGRLLPPALAEALTRGTSVGGARPKVLLTDRGRDLIAKFSSTTDIRPVVKAEGVAMDLARRVGLNVAPVQVTEVAGKDVLLVERFDRPGGGQRRHLVSALTILGLAEYTGAVPQLRGSGRPHPPVVHQPGSHAARTVLSHRVQHPGRQH